MTDPKDPTPAMDEEPEEENEEFSEEGPESAAEQDALMDAYLNNMQEAKEGEIRIGVVVAVGQDSVLINLDDKAEGIAPISDFIAPMGEITVKVGDEIEVLIQRRDTEEGQIRVSHRTAKRVKALDILADAVEKETPLTGVCSRTVKSGLIVDCGVDCFMPASQIDLRRVEKLEEWVGREIEFLVLELNRRRGRAVISRRKLMEMRRDQLRDEFLSSHGEGDVVRGVAKTVLDFGVFVDLNGIEAFIPREEISWERAASPVLHAPRQSGRGENLEIESGIGQDYSQPQTVDARSLVDSRTALPQGGAGDGRGCRIDQVRRLRAAGRGPDRLDPRVRSILVLGAAAPRGTPQGRRSRHRGGA